MSHTIKLSMLTLILLTFNVMANESDLKKHSTGIQPTKPDITYHSLTDLEWKYRLILTKSSNTTDITAIFNKYAEEIDDRKIAWFVLNGNELHSNILIAVRPGLKSELKNYLTHYKNDDMVLIGYDGEAKSVENTSNIVNFFEEIDRMPIRQYEMQVNSAN